MGKVIYVNFSSVSLDEEFYLEILDAESGDYYFYFEDEMIPEPTETESFQALSKMNDEYDSDFIKRF